MIIPKRKYHNRLSFRHTLVAAFLIFTIGMINSGISTIIFDHFYNISITPIENCEKETESEEKEIKYESDVEKFLCNLIIAGERFSCCSPFNNYAFPNSKNPSLDILTPPPKSNA